MEIWNLGVARPRGAAADARRLEEAGWSGGALVDSQNLSGDIYVALALAAEATLHRPEPGRHQSGDPTGSDDRGRHRQRAADLERPSGDGDRPWRLALADLGRSPARLASFERYVRNLRRYLAGESVPFEDIEMSDETAPPLEELGLAGAPQSSRIAWIGDVDRVPLEVAATGPRVIGIAARHADRVMFSLGAEPERLAWGIETARQARRDAGLDPDAITYGAYLNCAFTLRSRSPRDHARRRHHARPVLGDARAGRRPGFDQRARGARCRPRPLRHARPHPRRCPRRRS